MPGFSCFAFSTSNNCGSLQTRVEHRRVIVGPSFEIVKNLIGRTGMEELQNKLQKVEVLGDRLLVVHEKARTMLELLHGSC